MTSTAERLLTADEFMALPDDPSGGKMELCDGRVVVMPPPGEEHGDKAAIIFEALAPFVREHALGKVRFEVGFRIREHPDRVVAPDVSLFHEGSLPAARDRRKYVPVAPALAVEVASPNDTLPELLAKAGEYLEAGTRRVWIVRPAKRTVIVFDGESGDVRTLAAGDTLTSADAGFAVPGFELPLAALFA